MNSESNVLDTAWDLDAELASTSMSGTWTPGSKRPARASLKQTIAVSLREAIIAGTIQPGQQLKQDQLSDDFDVSPAPIREALRQLESEGLVEHKPNRGVFVADVPEEEMLALLLPIRLSIERYAMHLVAGRLDKGLVAELQSHILTMRKGADLKDVDLINRADVQFHKLVIQASHSYHAIQLWHSILPRIRLQLSRLTPRQADLHHVADEHDVLLAALREGDASRLDAVLNEHIIGIFAELMRKNELNTPSASAP